MSQPLPTPERQTASRNPPGERATTTLGSASRREMQAPPIPTESVSEQNADDGLRAYERAQLRLFQTNFNLILQEEQQRNALLRQMQIEMELTFGKVRALAEIAERVVNAADSQLEKQVAIVEALVVLYSQIVAREGNPEG